jgi:hypothetical protein
MIRCRVIRKGNLEYWQYPRTKRPGRMIYRVGPVRILLGDLFRPRESIDQEAWEAIRWDWAEICDEVIEDVIDDPQ